MIIQTLSSGDIFCELCLLYSSPLTTTIRAKTAAKLWTLDRESFNNIVKDAAQIKRQKYDDFLKKVSILSTMLPYERECIADALKEEFFKLD